MKIVEKSGITEMYAGRDFTAGPATYTSQEFLQKICEATGLNRTSRSVRALDSMSGAGLLGNGLQKLASRHRYFYLDLVHSQLLKISDAAGSVVGDARSMPFGKETFRVGIVRYAAKDIPEEQQVDLFREMYRVIARSGRWILADMYSPVTGSIMEDGQIYEWLNWQHQMKQEVGGRNRQTDGTCHIPTEDGWLELFRNAGFRNIEVFDHYTSPVTTTDWLSGKQVTEEQLGKLNQMILTAPRAVIRAFNIREDEGLVRIDYPVTIIRAVKP